MSPKSFAIIRSFIEKRFQKTLKSLSYNFNAQQRKMNDYFELLFILCLLLLFYLLRVIQCITIFNVFVLYGDVLFVIIAMCMKDGSGLARRYIPTQNQSLSIVFRLHLRLKNTRLLLN